jgi:hypothetical protein
MRSRLAVIGLLVCLISTGAWAIEWMNYEGNWNDPNGWFISGVAAGRIPTALDDVQIQGPNFVCTLNTSTGSWGQYRLRVNTSGTLRVEDGGQLLGSSWLRVSAGATPGTLIQTGGLVKIADGSDKAKLGVGDSAGSDGLYTISGGTLTTESTTGALNIGARGGKGKLVVIGSKATILMNTLAVPENSGTPSGTLEFQVDSTGVSPIGVKSSVTLDPKAADSTSALVVSAIAAPPIKDIVLVDLRSANAISGKFDTVNGKPAVEGAEVVLSAAGRTCTYTLTYVGGTGNDIVLVYQSAKTVPTTVIGDFENGVGDWTAFTGANATLAVSEVGATSGSHSLAVKIVGGYYAIQYNAPSVPKILPGMTLRFDLTMVQSEWTGNNWTKVADKIAVNSNGTSGWKEYFPKATDRVTGADTASDWGPWNPDALKTYTVDISNYDATGATWFQIVIALQQNPDAGAGNFYIDNVKLIAGEVAGASSVETFATAHNYLTGGLGTFDGIVDANHITAIDASTTRPGALYMASANSFWDPGPGPLMYKLVKGDFIATVKVTDFAGTLAAIAGNNDSGILARDPNTAAGENWVSVNYFPTWTGFVARNTIASVRAELGQTAGTWLGTDTFALAAQYPYIQLERKGSDFHFRISADGVTFIPLTKETYAGIYTGTQTPLVVSRPDMPATLQLGLMQCTYSTEAGYAAFDDFTIVTP